MAIRLLVVVNNYLPDRGGGGAIFADFCQSLAQRGFEVTVRCAYPYYPEWKDKSGRNGWRIWRYDEGGVHVERYGLYIPSNPNSLIQRLLHEASYLLSLLRSLFSRRRFDVVMAYCPAVGNLAYAVAHRLIFRTPLWLNVQDLAAQAAAAGGLVRSRWLGRLLAGVQRGLFNRADVWSTIAPLMLERLVPMRDRGQPLHLMPNWLDFTLAEAISASNSLMKPRVPHVPVRLLYSGNIGRKQNLLRFLHLLASDNSPFDFRVHGSGAAAAEVESWIKSNGDRRFTFGPFLGDSEYAAALSWADYFVITETGDAEGSFMPSKLIAGITAGCPILAVCDGHGPLAREVQDHGLGLCLRWPEAPQALARLREAPGSDYLAWRDAALKRARAYSRTQMITDFERELRIHAKKP